MSADISPNVVILTREELSERERKAFQRGIERGRFEHGLERTQQACSCPMHSLDERKMRDVRGTVAALRSRCGIQVPPLLGETHRVGAVRQKIVDAYLAGALDAARALGAFLLSKDITAAEIAKWMTAGALRGRAERYALKQSSDSVTEPKTNQP